MAQENTKYISSIVINNEVYEVKDSEARNTLELLFSDEIIINCGDASEYFEN